MILFLRTSDVSIDSRLLRYARALDRAGLPHAAAFWARGEPAATAVPFPQYRFASSPSGSGRRAMLTHLLRANLFFMTTIWSQRATIGLVHAIDLDTALAAWIMRRLTGVPYIYDAYDHYADSRGFVGRWRDWLARIEAAVFRDAACVILADPSRTAQHGPIPPDRLLIIENVPEVAQGDVTPRTRSAAGAAPLRIGYLGTFEPVVRGLEDVLAAVEANPLLELDIAGSGRLEPLIAAAAARCDRIRLHPPLGHAAGLALMGACDIVLGLYYTSLANHRFAAPNKYFEHLLVGRPLLTSAGTPPGRKVEEHDTGWAVEDGPAPVAAALAQAIADPAAVERKARNAAELWRRRFPDYFTRALCGDYVGAVRRAQRPLREDARR